MKSSQTLLLSVFALAVAVPVSAQVTSSPAATMSGQSAVASGPAEAWSAKPVGAYRVTLDIPGHPMTADITVKDVNGKLVANMWPVGDNDGHDMEIAVLGSQLVLSTDTPGGLVKVTMEHRGSAISGTWQHGDAKGSLTGEASK